MYVRMYVYAHRLEPLIDASTCVFLCGGVSAYRLVLLPRILTVFPSTFCLLLHSFSIIPSRPPPPLGPSSTGSSTFPHCQTELPWDASNVTYTQVLAHAATEPIHLWGSPRNECTFRWARREDGRCISKVLSVRITLSRLSITANARNAVNFLSTNIHVTYCCCFSLMFELNTRLRISTNSYFCQRN